MYSCIGERWLCLTTAFLPELITAPGAPLIPTVCGFNRIHLNANGTHYIPDQAPIDKIRLHLNVVRIANRKHYIPDQACISHGMAEGVKSKLVSYLYVNTNTCVYLSTARYVLQYVYFALHCIILLPGSQLITPHTTFTTIASTKIQSTLGQTRSLFVGSGIPRIAIYSKSV